MFVWDCNGLAVTTRFFRMRVGRRNDMSGEPWGFWFAWCPVLDTYRSFRKIEAGWSFGFFYHPEKDYPLSLRWGWRGV